MNPLAIPLNPLFSYLPTINPIKDNDYLVAFGLIFLTILVLTAPHNGAWRWLRVAFALPGLSCAWLWIIASVRHQNNAVHWGVTVMCFGYVVRLLEYLFFPPEEYCHRLVPKHTLVPQHNGNGNGHLTPNGHDAGTPKRSETDLVPEPVPPPFTWAKFCWASSLWWSYRGIGWNYSCPLPPSSLRDPYTRTSSRSRFLAVQVSKWAMYWLIDDLFRSIQYLSPASTYFVGQPGTPPFYTDLTQWQRALYSTSVVIRIWFSLHNAHILWGCSFVTIGGLLGWEGEMFTPWGWAPILGSLEDVWRYPGLSTLWSRTWQGYNRRWLYVLGWIGIGENLLGLTHTGISAHPSIPPEHKLRTSLSDSPHPSGQVSPSHPLPSGATRLPTKGMSSRLMLHSLAKSFIVFTMSGLQHDVGTLSMIIRNGIPERTVYLSDVLLQTPFFAVQPFALAFEAVIKSTWRGWKSKHHPEWRKRPSANGNSTDGKTSHAASAGASDGAGVGEPGWLVFIERAIGFAWTWVWLGWTAGWFVDAMAKHAVYSHEEGQPVSWSLSGGLCWGKWYY